MARTLADGALARQSLSLSTPPRVSPSGAAAALPAGNLHSSAAPANPVVAFRHVRYPVRARPPPPPATTMAPEANMPGTPPLEGLSAVESSPKIPPEPNVPPLLVRDVSREEDRPRRQFAAMVLQRCARYYLARKERARLRSAVGRPAQVRVMSVTNLEMLCDYRDVVSVFCNIRILKKPYGPFMFQFASSKCTHVNLPTWNDEFFVPMVSSRCEVVVTLIGVSTSGRLRFLGQAVLPLETGWERQRSEITAPLGKWTFPLDESLTGLHRFVTGNVCCAVTPLTARNTCLSGQFQMAPTVLPQRSSSFFSWTRRNSLPTMLTSPQAGELPQTPTAVRKEMVIRWGVLTDTHLHLFAHSTAKLIASLELSKLQLIKSSPLAKNAKSRREPGRLYALKIYAAGTMYSMFVTTYAQQLMWEFKIDSHRRQLLVP